MLAAINLQQHAFLGIPHTPAVMIRLTVDRDKSMPSRSSSSSVRCVWLSPDVARPLTRSRIAGSVEIVGVLPLFP